MGAATALYSATCFAQGNYGNGSPYPVCLRTIIGLSGWLPGARQDVLLNAYLVHNIVLDNTRTKIFANTIQCYLIYLIKHVTCV